MMRLFYNYSFCIALSFCLFFSIDAESVKENRNGKFRKLNTFGWEKKAEEEGCNLVISSLGPGKNSSCKFVSISALASTQYSQCCMFVISYFQVWAPEKISARMFVIS